MSLIPDKCVEYKEKRKVCIASEKGKTYRLENDKDVTIRKVKVDKCVSQAIGEKRCDYLMSIDEEELKKVFFIELKGGDLSEALKQLCQTIGHLKNDFKGYIFNARIVGRRDVPNIIGLPNYRKLYAIVTPTGGTIERGTNNIYTEKI